MSLFSKCQAPKCVDYHWLREHLIALLLDSLDEVLGNKLARYVNVLRDFVDRIDTPGIAVCSRTQEYEALPDQLKLGGAITLQPRRSEQVSD
jgi:eukaryotic-like serine/threonine-protein kinase